MTESGERASMQELVDELFSEGGASPSRPEVGAPASADGTDEASGPASPGTSSASAGLTITEVIKICMYSQAVPIITQERLLELEAELPAFVDFLGSLENRPLALAQFSEFLDSASHEAVQPKSSQELLAQQLGASDLAGSDENERFLPLVGVCIAAAALGYNVAHTWDR